MNQSFTIIFKNEQAFWARAKSLEMFSPFVTVQLLKK
jgi:hypothetical protein